MIQRVFQNTVQAGDLQAFYYNFVCSFKNNFVIKRFRKRKNTYRKLRKQIPADVYFPAIFKWAKSEGLENAFLLKMAEKRYIIWIGNFR